MMRVIRCFVVLAVFSLSATSASLRANPHFQFIPADTAFFFGSKTPNDLTKWMQLYGDVSADNVRQWILELKKEENSHTKLNLDDSPTTDDTDAGKTDVDKDVLEGTRSDDQGSEDDSGTGDSGLAEDTGDDNNDDLTPKQMAAVDWFSNLIAEPKTTLAAHGIDAETFNFSIYTVGPAITFRLSLADPELFIQSLDDFEHSEGLTARQETLSDVAVRFYDMSKRADDPTTSAIAVVEGDAVLTLSMSGLDSEHVAALGLTDVAQSFVQSQTVEQLQEKYGYGDYPVGFISSAGVVNIIKQKNPEYFTHAACDSEIASLTDIWPRYIFGYKDVDVTEDKVYAEGHLIVEINHPKVTDALKKIRGLIPSGILESNAMFAYGLGIDMTRLGTAASEIAALLTGFNYLCPALSGLNKIPPSTLQQGVIGINMAGGFANGVRGIAIALFDLDVEFEDDAVSSKTMKPKDVNFDGLISIQANNPTLLLQMAKLVPELAEFNLPDDGTPVDIGRFIADKAKSDFPVEMNVAKQANRVVGYSGAKATALAQQTQAENAPDNGVFYLSVNVRRYLKVFEASLDASIMESASSDAEIERKREALKTFLEWIPDGNLSYLVDFTDRGVEYDVKVDLKRSE